MSSKILETCIECADKVSVRFLTYRCFEKVEKNES
ncbi:hypothetical protein PMI22_03546 [Pseudomonas sp. GM21]|nr:hypothetical protein PMI22_03546 [Pseudomonas sp. GM21]